MFKTISMTQDRETEAATHWTKVAGAWNYNWTIKPVLEVSHHNYGDLGLRLAPGPHELHLEAVCAKGQRRNAAAPLLTYRAVMSPETTSCVLCPFPPLGLLAKSRTLSYFDY